MKVKILSRLGVCSLLLAATFFAGCAGGPAPVTEEQAAKAQEAPEVAAPEIEKTAPTPKPDAPPKIVAPQKPTTAQYWSEALMAYEDGDYSRALENVVLVRAAKPEYFNAREMETKLRFQLGDAAKGLPLLEEMVRKGEGGSTAIHTFAKWSAEKGQTSNAQNVLEELIGDVENADPEAIAALAWLYHTAGNEGEARELFALLDGKPQATDFAAFSARARLEAGDYSGVREVFNRNKMSIPVKLAMADANRMAGRASSAEKAYVGVLEREPENYWAKVNLAILKLSQGDAQGARAMLEQSAAERPENPEAWCNLGLALRKLGEHDQALGAYEKALEVAPEHPQTLKNIGILWEKYLGEPAKGLGYYERYLKVVGADEEVQRWAKAANRMIGSSQ